MRHDLRSRMLRYAIELVVLLALLMLLVRWLEPRMAFFPFKGEKETPRDFGVDFAPFTVETADGERLHGWTLRADRPRARIVYFHGNGGNLSMWAPILAGLAKHGYEVAAFDYRGYGVSTGRPTERGLYRDVDAVMRRVAGDGLPLVYWGRSLGAALAAYAATIKPPDGLILESGFPGVSSLIRESPPLWLFAPFASYRFPAAKFLQGVRAPVLVLHGDADSIIAFRHGQKLFEAIPGRKQFVTIRGGDHNDAVPTDPDTYWRSVDQFVDGLTGARR